MSDTADLCSNRGDKSSYFGLTDISPCKSRLSEPGNTGSNVVKLEVNHLELDSEELEEIVRFYLLTQL